METVDIDDVNPDRFGEGIDRHGLSEPLGTTAMAINYYRLAPGEGFPGGLHTHMDQEEVFVVVHGEATFETLDGEITVGEREAIRFAPGEFQSGKNESNDELVAFAMGAPRHSEDVRIPVDCSECNHDTVRIDRGGDRLTFVCPDCGDERIPQDCLECGDDDLRITLDEKTRTIVVCQNCGTEFERPPFRDSD